MTVCVMGGVLPAYSSRILRAASSHSSLKNGYDAIAMLLRPWGAGPPPLAPEPYSRRR